MGRKGMLPDSLTDRHLLLFGAIIQWFARYERLMLKVSCTVTGSDYGSIVLLTRGLDFEGKRRTLLDLLRDRPVPLDQYDRICDYVKIPCGLTKLRDDIAHSTWVEVCYSNGNRRDWPLRLSARVKPLRHDSNPSGSLFFEDADKIGYSIGDLEEVVRNLSDNYESFANYLHGVSLIQLPPAEVERMR
jgi:hypothetical protein